MTDSTISNQLASCLMTYTLADLEKELKALGPNPTTDAVAKVTRRWENTDHVRGFLVPIVQGLKNRLAAANGER